MKRIGKKKTAVTAPKPRRARRNTGRKRMEEALQRSQAELKAIYDHAPIMMCVVDEERRVLFANRAFAEFAGVSQAALRAGHACGVFGCVNALTHPRGCGFSSNCADCALRLAIEETFMTGSSHRKIERRLTLERGSLRRDVVLLGATALIPAAEQSRLLLCLVDITARKQAEDELLASREQLQALTVHLQTVREEERTRIARAIHDELGQELTGLKMDLRWLEHGLEDLRDPRVIPLLEKTMAATDLVDTTIRTVQRIAADLRPAVLDKLGLVAAVRREASQFQQHSGIACRLTGPDLDPKLPEPTAIACFRIFQEAMTNVSRHAAATAVEVDFQTPPDGLVLEVRDNGKGISTGLAEKAESLGLLGMQERARALGGEVMVKPRAEGGTVVRLWIPKTGET